jgi:hypothetical protein
LENDPALQKKTALPYLGRAMLITMNNNSSSHESKHFLDSVCIFLSNRPQ